MVVWHGLAVGRVVVGIPTGGMLIVGGSTVTVRVNWVWLVEWAMKHIPTEVGYSDWA